MILTLIRIKQTCQKFLFINIRPSRIQDPFEYKMHQKILEINIRPSYNREITVFGSDTKMRLLFCKGVSPADKFLVVRQSQISQKSILKDLNSDPLTNGILEQNISLLPNLFTTHHV